VLDYRFGLGLSRAICSVGDHRLPRHLRMAASHRLERRRLKYQLLNHLKMKLSKILLYKDDTFSLYKSIDEKKSNA
jgi:hypothetical protein